MNEWSYTEWKEQMQKEGTAAFYLYTPLCGTCAVASKMMTVVSQMRPGIPIGKTNLNYMEELAIDYEVESVPCLLIKRSEGPVEKIYAFQSVQNILDKLS